MQIRATLRHPFARPEFGAFAALALAACAMLAGCGGASDPAPVATNPPPSQPETPPDGPMVRPTSAGKVEGVDDSAATGTWSWKGVPFAEPPVGPLRWRAPVEPKAWSGIRPAATFGPACLQIGRMFGPGANNTYDLTIASTMGQPLGSEDCLTLNIWRPASTENDLPVLVFVHGGSNISGYAADPLYDGAALAKATNAVVVTVQYRLGVLGFLSVPQLHVGGTAGDDSGNFALLDNMAALRFIQHNIASFGGNPGNVTLSGESAGANNVLAVMTSPMAKGLFHRMIALSGGISLDSNLPTGASPALNHASVAAAQGQAVLESLVIAAGKAADTVGAQAWIATQSPAQIAEFMRGQDGNALLETVLAKGLNTANPIPDGSVVPLNPIESIAAGDYVKVPTIVGNTREEGKLFAALLPLFGGKPGFIVDDATRFTMMYDFDPDAPPSLTTADLVDASYLPVTTAGTGFNARTQLITQLLFEANSANLLGTLKTQQANVWQQRFDWAQEAAPWNEVYGAAHAFDLAFMFGNFGPSIVSGVIGGNANKAGRVALSGAMQASLSAFMREGDPNAPALGVTWAPWPARLLLDATPTALAVTAP